MEKDLVVYVHRMDMIQTLKIINKIDDVKMEGLFELTDSITRGHSLKLKKSPEC